MGSIVRIGAGSVVLKGARDATDQTVSIDAIVGGSVSTPASDRPVTPWVDARDRGPFLELIGGDGLPGEPRVAKDRVEWVHPWLGTIPLVADGIARVRLQWDSELARFTDSDAVLLRNGDVTRGFIEAIGAEIAIAPIDPAADGGPQAIPFERIAAISLAKVDAAPESGSWMWFEDGTRLRVGSPVFDAAGGWTFTILDPELSARRAQTQTRTAEAPESRIPPDPVEIVFDRAAFQPLGSIGAPSISAAKGSYRYDISRAVRIERSPRTPLGIPRIAIDGPCVANFGTGGGGIAPGAAVFSCEVVRPHGATTGSRVSIRVTFDGAATETVTIDSSVARASLRVERGTSASGGVSIEVGDGGDGIVGDSLLLERAVIVRSIAR